MYQTHRNIYILIVCINYHHLATPIVNITADIIPISDMDIHIIVEYENEELSICSDKVDQPADVDYTFTNMKFPDTNSVSSFKVAAKTII